jgi:anti-anti-sigma regulatory factor
MRLTVRGDLSDKAASSVNAHSSDPGVEGETATLGDCVIDVTGLRFIDISGMRAIAHAAQAAGDAIRLHGASADLRRFWDVCGFKDSAPKVQFGSLPRPRGGLRAQGAGVMAGPRCGWRPRAWRGCQDR